jgi:hypothetical protein
METVVVLADRHKVYKEWALKNKQEGVTYAYVWSIEGIKVLKFSRIIRLSGFENIPDIEEIMDYIESHRIKEKQGFWFYIQLVLLTPIWFFYRGSQKKHWAEFKSGLMKHEHYWDYSKPITSGINYYPCKHLGCNYVYFKE